ncbi:MAG: hypothetical protein J6P42_04150 [Oscillospiraceae bacterium]|nr:hypothetical protein [Oscillospiraceae bacterium]
MRSEAQIFVNENKFVFYGIHGPEHNDLHQAAAARGRTAVPALAGGVAGPVAGHLRICEAILDDRADDAHTGMKAHMEMLYERYWSE